MKKGQAASNTSLIIPQDLKWEIKAAAAKRKMTLSAFVINALRAELRRTA